MTGIMDLSEVRPFLKFDENGKVRDDLYNYRMIFLHDSQLQGICFNEATRSIVVNGQLPWQSEDGEWIARTDFNEFRGEISKTVIGQNNLLLVLLSVYLYLKNIADDRQINKHNILLCGPSGCGKTETVRALKSYFKQHIPLLTISLRDTSKITSEGYSGMNTSYIVQEFRRIGSNGIGIVFLDEFDKRIIPDMNHGENVKNTPHKTPTLFRSSEGRIHSTFFGHPVEYWTEGYVPCIGVKIPSQVDFDLAMTSLRGESDKGDKSESGLQPEGGDNRCTNRIATFTVDANGNTSTTFTSAYDRIYYLKELVAGKGYELDSRVYTVTVDEDGVVEADHGVSTTLKNDVYYMHLSDIPMRDDLRITIDKTLSDGTIVPNDTGAYNGAKFRLEYYTKEVTDFRSLTYADATVVFEFTVNSRTVVINRSFLARMTPVKGTNLFTSFSGNSMPLGTYRLQEIDAPDGFEAFLERGAISKAQFDKSLGDLTVKMGMSLTGE